MKSIQARSLSCKNFIARSFKETQMEWFGKRDISWHIRTVYVTPAQTNVKSLCTRTYFVSQSARTVVVAAVMCHTLQEEKARHPETNEAFYQSDCAGSYASGGLLVPIWTPTG